MESLIVGVNWTAVIVGAIVAYVLGWLWFSENLFAAKWRAGIGTPAVMNAPMFPAMFAQAVGTFLLAWVIGITASTNSLGLAILIILTAAILIKANGFFGGKTKYAVSVETSYVIVMGIVMILTHAVL